MNLSGCVKVFLPGESLWAKPITYDGDLMRARLRNEPASELHGYKFDDLVLFKKHPEHGSWELFEQ